MWALSGTRSAHWGKHHPNFQSSNLRMRQGPFLLKEFTAMHWRRFKRHTNKSWHDGFCSLLGSGSVRFGISDLSPMQGKTFIKWGLNFTESLSSSTYRWKGCSCITARKCRSGCGAHREKGENSHWPFCCLKDWMEPEWWTIFPLRVPVELRSCPRGMQYNSRPTFQRHSWGSKTHSSSQSDTCFSRHLALKAVCPPVSSS